MFKWLNTPQNRIALQGHVLRIKAWLASLRALLLPSTEVPSSKGLLLWTAQLQANNGLTHALQLWAQQNGRYRVELHNGLTGKADATLHYRLVRAIETVVRLWCQFHRIKAAIPMRPDAQLINEQQPYGAVSHSGGATWTEVTTSPRAPKAWRAARWSSSIFSSQPSWSRFADRRLRRQ